MREKVLPERLKLHADKLLESEPIKGIILFHQKCFGELYTECKKGSDPFKKFQFRWHHYCSALLLAGSYQLSAIKLEESSNYLVNEARKSWLDFCEEHNVPVPESNR